MVQNTSIINSLKKMLYNEPKTLVDFDVFLIMKERITAVDKWKIISILKYLDAYDHRKSRYDKKVFTSFTSRKSLP